MKDSEIKQVRKIILQQLKIAEERLESASFVLQREAKMDAIPILYKAVDIAARILLAFKQKSLADFRKNIKSLEEEYKKEGLCNEETIELFHSLYDMNEKYTSEIEFGYDYREVKSTFGLAENFLGKTFEFLKTQLTTSKERRIKRRARKILLSSGILISSLVVLFFLIKLGINKSGPKHGLLAHYYSNIYLNEPYEVKRIDKKIDFVWGYMGWNIVRIKLPHPKIRGNFSVRWEGRIKIYKSDNYTFYISSDEGSRLFLDDEIVIDTWSNKDRPLESSGDVHLEEGFHKIKLEYYFNQVHPGIILLWSSNSFKKRIIENKVLYPPPALSGQR